MALFCMDIHSECLTRMTSLQVILPDISDQRGFFMERRTIKACGIDLPA